MEEEFEAGKDSQLCDFHDDFPTKLEGDAKNQQIIDLIKTCYKVEDVSFDISMPDINRQFFEVSTQELDDIKKVYQKQCPTLYAAGMEGDNAFLSILAIQQRSKCNYLEFIIHDYMRSRVNNIKTVTGPILPSANTKKQRDPWYEERFNESIKKLGKTETTNPLELVQNAVKSFGARACPKLMFANIISINDSIEVNVNYIISTLEWITEMIKDNPDLICPFQYDLCIGVGKPSQTENKQKFSTANDDEDDDDDDDDNGDDEKTAKNKNELPYVDVVGDIETKLQKNNLKYVKDKFQSGPGNKPQTRLYDDMMKKLRQQLDKQTFPHKGNAQYPHRSRFIGYIDRRSKGKKEKDDIYLFTAPVNCRNIPNDYVPEWFVSASKTSLIPDEKYGDGSAAIQQAANKQKGNETKDKLLKSNISSTSHVKGALLTISFIVEESDRIKAYIYYNGQIHYFRPEVFYYYSSLHTQYVTMYIYIHRTSGRYFQNYLI